MQPWDGGAAVSPCSRHRIEECYLEQTCLPNRLAVICQIQFCHDSLNSFHLSVLPCWLCNTRAVDSRQAAELLPAVDEVWSQSFF